MASYAGGMSVDVSTGDVYMFRTSVGSFSPPADQECWEAWFDRGQPIFRDATGKSVDDYIQEILAHKITMTAKLSVDTITENDDIRTLLSELTGGTIDYGSIRPKGDPIHETRD